MKNHHKMRVWDSKVPRMFYQNDEKPWLFQTSENDNFPVEIKSLMQLGGLIWEQCTGLDDKNGVLIFEGDNLKIPGLDYPLPVVFVSGCFDFEENEHDLVLWENAEFCEIIGNIHKVRNKNGRRSNRTTS